MSFYIIAGNAKKMKILMSWYNLHHKILWLCIFDEVGDYYIIIVSTLSGYLAIILVKLVITPIIYIANDRKLRNARLKKLQRPH